MCDIKTTKAIPSKIVEKTTLMYQPYSTNLVMMFLTGGVLGSVFKKRLNDMRDH